MKRLSGLDSSFLYLETPSSHMHVAATSVFDSAGAAEPLTYERVVAMTGERLHLLPPFRQRLAEIPFHLHHPLWVEDPDFDIEYHVRRDALPSPGGIHQLAELAADIISRPLDRTRPLWEMHVVEGLEAGHVALLTKTHHAAVDGVSGNELTMALLDLEPNPPPKEPPAEPWKPERVPNDFERVSHALISLSRKPFGLFPLLPRTVKSAFNLGQRISDPTVASSPLPFQAPRTSINVALTPHRCFSFTQVPLAEVKAIKNKLGGTVNDVVLALCAGALRRYFESRGEEVSGPLVAMVPISVRDEAQKSSLGNRISMMFVSLATTIADPVRRLQAISEGTRGAKDQHHAIGAQLLTDWAEFAAPAVVARAMRLYSRMRLADLHRPLFNVTISNVPGPPFPLYAFGARLVANYPMGPIFDGAALNLTVMSYMDSMFFGVVGCREVVRDPWIVVEGVEESLDELKKATAST